MAIGTASASAAAAAASSTAAAGGAAAAGTAAAAGGAAAAAGSSFSYLSLASMALTAVSTIAQYQGTIAQGNAQSTMENYQAAQARQEATQAQATGSQQAMQQSRVAGFAESTANADATGSGGDPLSPSTIGVEKNIAGQGEFNVMTALYNGDEKAAGLNQEASTDVFQGQLDQQTAGTKAFGTILGGASSMLTKYGNIFTPNTGSGGLNSASNLADDPEDVFN